MGGSNTGNRALECICEGCLRETRPDYQGQGQDKASFSRPEGMARGGSAGGQEVNIHLVQTLAQVSVQTGNLKKARSLPSGCS